jgi:hydrogenase-4 component E
METTIILAVIAGAYLMMAAKRIASLVTAFRLQSFLLFIYTLIEAVKQRHAELYIVALLLFVLKVVLIPHILAKIVRKIKVNENLGLFVNVQLSLLIGLAFTYCSWIFSRMVVPTQDTSMAIALTAAFTVTLAGMFIMIFRMKALSQTIGLLVMENGIFLLAASIAGGMPFFVEIAIFLDILISVIILNVFVYRINKLFTHIDAGKLNQLKG